LHAGCSILQINMPVVYIHTIVNAKGALKYFLNKGESLSSQYYCMWINRKNRYQRRQKNVGL